MSELISKDFLRIIAMWSIIPTYTIAGATIGYGLDRWFGTLPWFTALGVLIALVGAVRDLFRLREQFVSKPRMPK